MKKNIFTQHPNEAGESYVEHFLFSFGVGLWLLYCACAAICHAIFPFTCTYTTSSNLKKVHIIMQKRLEVLAKRREDKAQAQTQAQEQQ